MDNDTEVIMGRVFLGQHIMPAARQLPRVGDVVYILAGKASGRVGKVAGRLDLVGETRWSVMRDDGVIIGQYPPEQLSIVMEGS